MVLNLTSTPTSSPTPPPSTPPSIQPELLRPAAPRRSPLRPWLLGAVALVLTCAVMIFWHHRVDRELRALPGPERRALFQRTLQNVLACDRLDASTLEDTCREQADLLRRFPECDDSCRKLARHFLGQPGR